MEVEMTNAADALRELRLEMEDQSEQLPLASQATDIIPGEGESAASIVLIGEAPGYHEHVQRRPFVGRSGQLLRKVLSETAGISDTDVYITNIVKVRPPENRDPTPAEIAAFRPYLNREIEIINPELIVTLGRFSMAKFLPDVRISQVHGRLHAVEWNGKRMYILPMYHPAAALRSTKMKEAFVADFAKIANILSWVRERAESDVLKDSVKNTLL